VCSLFEEIYIHENKINRFLKQISILGTLIKESKKLNLLNLLKTQRKNNGN